ncbi:TetR/AcrR family transcriptional regulator [Gordonia sp. UBA5067]|uniref:TetR/AcrR family transcriptional regulator n=1 Tax=Gordonia sp. UBA5067 TaxID=1946575 RepID=UPI0025BEA158|nr:TetR/AcrR family transcriptional regulator [Gordonia sp. UBA5067]
MGARTDTRQRMVTGAALLIGERGVAGTSIAGVLEQSRSPRGSVGFHFPGGRAELLSDALRWVGGLVSARLREGVEQGVAPTDLYRAICEQYRDQLADTEYTAGCPIGAAAQEAYADDDLGPVVAEIVGEWVSLLTEALVRAGHRPDEAGDIALLCVSSLEGAIMMARVTSSPRPLALTLAAMTPLLAAPDATGN